jgi:hypothetical protein
VFNSRLSSVLRPGIKSKFWEKMLKILVKVVLRGAFVTLTLFLFVSESGFNYNPAANWNDVLAGVAPWPFIGRQLVPICIHGILMVLPESASKASGLWDFSAKGGLALLSLLWLFLFYSSFFIELLARQYTQNSWYSYWCSLFFLFPGLCLFFAFGYFYDFATVFCATALLYFISKNKPGHSLAVFSMLSINRETSFLFIPLFLCLEVKNYKTALCIATIIYSLTRCLIWVYYFNNHSIEPVPSLGAHLTEFYANLFDYFEEVFFLISVTLLVYFNWPKIPHPLRTNVIIVYPLSIAYVLKGWPHELRVFFEVYPALFLILAWRLHSLATENTG